MSVEATLENFPEDQPDVAAAEVAYIALSQSVSLILAGNGVPPAEESTRTCFIP